MTRCEYISYYTFQGFSVLNLSIINPHNTKISTLENAIKYYELKNLHNNEKDFNCPLCECNIIITQSVIIYFLKILIINFKRI